MSEAIRDGWSWSRIGDALGVSRQAAHKKHGQRVRSNGDSKPRVVVSAAAREAMRCAREEAIELGVRAVGSEHILVGLARVGGRASDALSAAGATLARLRDAVAPATATRPVDGVPALSPLARAMLEQALRETVERGDPELYPEHILFAALSEPGGGAVRTLERLGVAAGDVRTELEWTR